MFAIPLSAFAVATHAAECSDTGFHCYYVGGNVAIVRNTDDAGDMDSRLASQGYTTSTDLSGQTRFGGEVFGGYRWEKWAAELTYAHLGRMDTVINGSTPVDPEYLRAISKAHPRSGEGPQLSALYHLRMNDRWEWSFRGGVFYWRNTLSAEGFGRYSDVKDRQLDPFAEVGAQRRRVGQRWSVVAGVRVYVLDGEAVTAIQLGAKYLIR
ncbi:MAG: outer membrane beta-barrel protein [Candidatus Obscuribacterales bacterium]|nr:outer membrane beta-barrel protein [Steroidobacteraceae bacterium]